MEVVVVVVCVRVCVCVCVRERERERERGFFYKLPAESFRFGSSLSCSLKEITSQTD